MKQVWSFLYFILLPAILSAGQAPGADPPLIIHGFSGKLTITSRVYCLIDPAPFGRTSKTPASLKAASFATIQSLPFSVPYDSLVRQFYRDPSPYDFWLKFGLQNNTDTSLDLYVYCGDFNYTDLYLVSAGRIMQQVTGGDLRKPSGGNSYAQRRSSTLLLRLGPHQAGEVFQDIRQRTDEFDFSGPEIFDRDSLNAAVLKDLGDGHGSLIFQLLFQGFLLCQMLYVLFQSLIIRRKEYVYYFFYLFVTSLYFLSKQESQLGIALLFSPHPLLKVYLGKTLLILPYFFYFRFVRSFLEMRDNYPALHKWVVRVENFLLAYMVFDLGFILFTFNRRLQTEIYTVVLLLVFILATGFMVFLLRKRQTLVYYIISGSLFVATGHITGLIISYLEFDRHVDLGIPNIFIFAQAGIVLEIFCFTAGLSYKSQASEKEKIKSQERLIEQLKANELLQSRMQHIRNKIAQDLHDDIGSTLSSISILSGLALEHRNSGRTLEAMSEISESSIMLMERMDDIVWSINPRNDSLENLLVRIRHFATTLFDATEISYTIDIQEKIHEVKLPSDYRQHIYLVLKEAINNLVKYARATSAAIEVGFDRQILTLSVRDNGRGFDAAGRRMGNGIPGMQRRAELMDARLEIQSKPGEGTVVSLSVTIR